MGKNECGGLSGLALSGLALSGLGLALSGVTKKNAESVLTFMQESRVCVAVSISMRWRPKLHGMAWHGITWAGLGWAGLGWAVDGTNHIRRKGRGVEL